MVQTDVSQLLSECSEWRQILRNYREEFHDNQKALQATCRKSLLKDQLQEVEHFDNQFNIQLINIHDLKQDIKTHERQVQFEISKDDNVTDELYSKHEKLLDEFIHLENTLQELRSEFHNFISATNC
jgi:chromosome segregation ATPase